VALRTPSVIDEKANNPNKYDSMLDEYSAVSRSVASYTGSILCDLRKIFLDHLRLNNPSNAEKNILTYDGVHLNGAGNRLVVAQMMMKLEGMKAFSP